MNMMIKIRRVILKTLTILKKKKKVINYNTL